MSPIFVSDALFGHKGRLVRAPRLYLFITHPHFLDAMAWRIFELEVNIETEPSLDVPAHLVVRIARERPLAVLLQHRDKLLARQFDRRDRRVHRDYVVTIIQSYLPRNDRRAEAPTVRERHLCARA